MQVLGPFAARQRDGQRQRGAPALAALEADLRPSERRRFDPRVRGAGALPQSIDGRSRMRMRGLPDSGRTIRQKATGRYMRSCRLKRGQKSTTSIALPAASVWRVTSTGVLRKNSTKAVAGSRIHGDAAWRHRPMKSPSERPASAQITKSCSVPSAPTHSTSRFAKTVAKSQR